MMLSESLSYFFALVISLPSPSCFVAPLPVMSDQSLMALKSFKDWVQLKDNYKELEKIGNSFIIVLVKVNCCRKIM